MNSFHSKRILVACALMSLAACKDETSMVSLENPEMRVTPMTIQFPGTYLENSMFAEVKVQNGGKVSIELPVSVSAPFSAEVLSMTVEGGETRILRVFFTPHQAGSFSDVLKLGSVEVSLAGEGLVWPVCEEKRLCQTTQFDASKGICVSTALPDHTECASACLINGGVCADGQCVGTFRNCSDDNACTTDFCSPDTGCGHAPLTCPPNNNPCKIATCDPKLGCVMEDVRDGVLCAYDDCGNSVTSVCIAGECVERTKPAGVPTCSNTWVQADASSYSEPEVQLGFAMTYDSVEQKVVLFGGGRFDACPECRLLPYYTNALWAWNGTTWKVLSPHQEKTGPRPRVNAAVAFDTVRQELVVHGGQDIQGNALTDTWVWKHGPNGGTWIEKLLPNGSSIFSKKPGRVDMVFVPEVPNPSAILAPVTLADSSLGAYAWDGSTWSFQTPLINPNDDLKGDSNILVNQHGRVMLFSYSFEGCDDADAETIRYEDKLTMTSLSPQVSFQLYSTVYRGYHIAAAFEPTLGAPLIVWGSFPSATDTTFAYNDHGDITEPSLDPLKPSKEPGCIHCDMAFDEWRQRMVLFGGQASENASTNTHRTWMYIPPK